MKIKPLTSDRFLKRYYPFISLVAFIILASITFSVVLSQNSLDSRSNAAGEVGKVEIVDGNGNRISQTNSSTVKVKLTSPWSVNLNTAHASGAENVLGESTTGNGLLATYFNNSNLSSQVAQRVDSKIDFDWGGGAPMSTMGRDTFSIRWQGYIKPASSGNYTIYARSDDGVRVWVGNKLIINHWKDRGFRESRGTIALSKDVMASVKVEYYENRGGAAARLSWSGPGVSKRVIDKEYLFASLPSTVTPTPTVYIPTATPTVYKPTATPTVYKPSATPISSPTATIIPPTATVGPTLTTAPIYTNVITLAEDALFTKNKKEIAVVNQNPLITEFTFSDATPGIKTIYARFVASNGLVQSYSSYVNLVTPTNISPTPPIDGGALLPWDTTGAGFGPRPASSPYVQCTVAEHESYKVTAPDGRTYATWHPATITRANGQKCAFGHEHGSNPARVPGAHTPYFAHGDHLGEAGPFSYKVKAVELENGRKALFTMHFGTTVPDKAACNPFHWINLQFVSSTGVLEADISLMADFGEAVRNADNQPLTPSACPNQAAEGRARGYGARLNPVGPDPRIPDPTGQSPIFYYPWRMDTSPNVLGFNDGALTVNTKQVVALCKDLNCNQRIIEHSANSQMNHGIWNFWSANTGWGIVDPKHSDDGVFYTDHFGKRLLNASDPMAVRQYVRPGTNIRLTKLSDQHSYFPVKGSGTYGDWIYRQMANGNPSIAGEHDANADRVDGPDTYAVWGDN